MKKLAAALVVVCAVSEAISSTPYGKFGSASGLLTYGLHPKLGWWIMELPCSMVFAYSFFVKGGAQSSNTAPKFFAFVFMCHYLYRGWLYPIFMIKVHSESARNFDVAIAFGSWVVTVTHGYLNARMFAQHGRHLADRAKTHWFQQTKFRLGIAIYYTFLACTIYHDYLMRELRPCPNGERYCIPTGGLYDYVTSAQYLCELCMWFGFAMASGFRVNGLFILCVSLVNLVPRSIANHEWYLSKFDSYEALGRARLVPKVW